MGDYDVDFEPDELGKDVGSTLGATLRPSILDRDVATFNPVEFTQSLHESVGPFLLCRGRGRTQESDGAQFHRLLRPRRPRPRRRSAAEQRDDLSTPHHSITSSARASSVSGTVSPSALAVLRLITSSYLVGACTGKSPGFSPLRMRST